MKKPRNIVYNDVVSKPQLSLRLFVSIFCAILLFYSMFVYGYGGISLAYAETITNYSVKEIEFNSSTQPLLESGGKSSKTEMLLELNISVKINDSCSPTDNIATPEHSLQKTSALEDAVSTILGYNMLICQMQPQVEHIHRNEGRILNGRTHLTYPNLEEFRSITKQEKRGSTASQLVNITHRLEPDGTPYNYASSSKGAKVVAHNKEAKGANNVLNKDHDKYLRNPCSVVGKFFVIEFADETLCCVRRSALQCEVKNNITDSSKEDGFLKMELMKLPDFAERSSTTEDVCRSRCLGNCSCIGYAFDSSIGCMSWSIMIDIQQLQSSGKDLYIHVAHSELVFSADHRKEYIKKIVIPVIVGSLTLCVCLFLCYTMMVRRRGVKREEVLLGNRSPVSMEELPLFSLDTLVNATSQFNEDNKLGQGGFGPVYKGKLEDGKEIAVKRLSKASKQGLEEFMNEVLVISKVQHRNLVRLCGCCVDEEEKMLIYEYMPKKSLDVFLFDEGHRDILDWTKRSIIIEGVGRGLLYLHRDSRLKIIHRDLKPSNILLDNNFNPKISDFGMARIFGSDQDQADTMRVVGTYGYMAPEYAMEGRFSEKSDVFSFGVLVLEIISGRKSTSSWTETSSLSLMGYAWKLWKEQDLSTFIDPFILNTSSKMEIRKCIQIGLLCVQEFAEDRPNISSVLVMLTSETTSLPAPSRPAFTERRHFRMCNENRETKFTLNKMSITNLTGR